MTAGYYISFKIRRLTQILIKHVTHRQVVGETLDIWGTRHSKSILSQFFRYSTKLASVLDAFVFVS